MSVLSCKGQRSKVKVKGQGRRRSKIVKEMTHITCTCLVAAVGSRAGRSDASGGIGADIELGTQYGRNWTDGTGRQHLRFSMRLLAVLCDVMPDAFVYLVNVLFGTLFHSATIATALLVTNLTHVRSAIASIGLYFFHLFIQNVSQQLVI